LLAQGRDAKLQVVFESWTRCMYSCFRRGDAASDRQHVLFTPAAAYGLGKRRVGKLAVAFHVCRKPAEMFEERFRPRSGSHQRGYELAKRSGKRRGQGGIGERPSGERQRRRVGARRRSARSPSQTHGGR
jgi:hypothetical protein